MLLLNARSLLPKLDELRALLSVNTVDMVVVTETWFSDAFDDCSVSINGYNLFRRDRRNGRGGGVCIYISEILRANRRTDLDNDNFECLWLWLRPARLPRPFCGIAVCALYHPPGLPSNDHQSLKEYLFSTIDLLRDQYPNCGIILLGDFNDLEVSLLLASP